MKATSTVQTQKVNESPPKKPVPTTKIEPLQLTDHHTNDTRRDEAVNTIDSTFRRSIPSNFPFEIIPFVLILVITVFKQIFEWLHIDKCFPLLEKNRIYLLKFLIIFFEIKKMFIFIQR